MDAKEENLKTAEESLTLIPGDSHSTGERETNDEGMGEHRWPRLVGDVVRSDTWRNVAMEERTPTS